MNEKAINTINRIKGALSSEDNKVPNVIMMIHELSVKAFTITNNELADLIRGNEIVCQKILTASNTLAYNPGGNKIEDIESAVQVIGYEVIRNLTISLMLVENSKQTLSADEQKEAALMSLTTGMLAQAVAKKNPKMDSSKVFLCALLRNYGVLLLTVFMIEEYRQVAELIPEVGDDEAYLETFGITPLNLGKQLLQSDALPAEIKACLDNNEVDIHDLDIDDESSAIYGVTVFSNDLVELITDPELSPNDYETQIEFLCGKYNNITDLSPDSVADILKSTESQLRDLSRQLNLTSLSTHIGESIHSRVKRQSPPPLKSRALTKRQNKNIVKNTQKKEETKETAAEILLTGIRRMQNLGKDEKSTFDDLNNWLSVVLLKGIQASDVVCFTKSPSSSDQFKAVFGKGSLLSVIKGRNLSFLQTKSIFTLCSMKKEIVSITNSKDKKVAHYIPEWMKLDPHILSFILIPLVVDDKVYAIILCGRVTKPPLQLSVPEHQAIKKLRTVYLDSLQNVARSMAKKR